MDECLMIKNIKEGDMDSFTVFVRMYEKRIYGFLFNMTRDRESSRDLTQDVLLKVFTSIYRFDETFPLKPWVFKIAYNTAINYIKSHSKVPTPLDDNMKCESSILNEVELKSILRDEINRFESYARAVLLLKILEDFSFEQIAAMLNTTAAGVKMKYYRNRKILVDRLKNVLKEE